MEIAYDGNNYYIVEQVLEKLSSYRYKLKVSLAGEEKMVIAIYEIRPDKFDFLIKEFI